MALAEVPKPRGRPPGRELGLTKKLLMVLAACVVFASQAWAGPSGEAPAAPSSTKKVPIIDVVAITPAPVDPARLLSPSSANSADLRLDPGLVQALNLSAKPEGGQGQSPVALQAGPLNAQLGSLSDSPLDRRMEGLRQPGASNALSYQHDSRLNDPEQQGGFLALSWKASASGEITLGGGYTRSYTPTSSAGSGTAGAVRGGGASLSSSTPRAGDGGTVNTESNGRWGAFLAVPYKLGKNLGVRPEVSYFRGDMPEAGRDTANEWVMGLRFTFGF